MVRRHRFCGYEATVQRIALCLNMPAEVAEAIDGLPCGGERSGTYPGHSCPQQSIRSHRSRLGRVLHSFGPRGFRQVSAAAQGASGATDMPSTAET